MGGLDPLATLSRRLADQVPEWFGEGARLVTLEPARSARPWSYLLRYELTRPGADPAAIIVKIPREPGIDTLAEAFLAEQWTRATELEHATLAAVAELFDEGDQRDFACVRPLAYLRPWNALVTEELRSRPLRDLLLDPRVLLGGPKWVRRCERVLERAGEWLHRYHRTLGDYGPQELDVSALRTGIGAALEQLESALVPAAHVSSLRQVFASALHLFEGSTCCVATLHGDYNAVNVLVTSDLRVAVLDMNEDVVGPVEADVAGLAGDLLTRKALVLPYVLLGRRRRLVRWAAAVPRGYAGGAGHSEQLLALLSAVAVLEKWAQDEQAGTLGAVGRLTRRAFRRYYRGLAADLLRLATAGSP